MSGAISNGASGDAVAGSARASANGNVNYGGTQVNKAQAEGGDAVSGPAIANAEGIDGVAVANAKSGLAVGGDAVATADHNVNDGGVQVNLSEAEGGDAISGPAIANAEGTLGGAALADAESGIARGGDADAHADANVNRDGVQVNRAAAEGGDAVSGPAVANAEGQFGGVAVAEAESGFARGGDAESHVEENVNVDGVQNNLSDVEGGAAVSGAVQADAAAFSPFDVAVADASSGNAVGGPAFGEVEENVNVDGVQNNVLVVEGGDAATGDAAAEATAFNPFGPDFAVATAETGNAAGGPAEGEIEENVNLFGRQDNVLVVDGGNALTGNAEADADGFGGSAVATAATGNAVGGPAEGEIEENVNLFGRQNNVVELDGGNALTGDAAADADASGFSSFAVATADTGNAVGGYAIGGIEENVNVDGVQNNLLGVDGGTAVSGNSDAAADASGFSSFAVATADTGNAFGGFAEGEIEENVNLFGRQDNVVELEGGNALTGDAGAFADGFGSGFAAADADTGNAFAGFAEGEAEDNVNVLGFQDNTTQVEGGTAVSGDVDSQSSSADGGIDFGAGFGVNIAVAAGNVGVLGGTSEGTATAGNAFADADNPVDVTFDNDGGVAFAGAIGNLAYGEEAVQVSHAEADAGGEGFAIAQTTSNLTENGFQSNTSGAGAYGYEPVEAYADTSGNYTQHGEQYNDSRADAGSDGFDLGI